MFKMFSKNYEGNAKVSRKLSNFTKPTYGFKPEKCIPAVIKLFHFYTPWKRQKSRSFLTFSGGVEMQHWHEMG